MPPEVSARVFEPYYTTKGERGSGLGLAMVFGIVERHGGSIEVASTPGHGTTFRLRLPRAGVAADVSRASADAEAPEQRLRILAVDDEPGLRRLVEHILRQRGHTVTVASSAEQALEQLARSPFDVVVSDLGLGSGMNGWDLAQQVRDRWPATRFVLVTGWGAALELADARPRGVDAIVAKPYHPGELIATVRAVVTPVGV